MNVMKGIILAGGKATRLYPVTKGTCKQLLPVYDKPMIYYPLSVLMLAGIRDILIISTPDDIGRFQKLLNDGSHLGVNISYAAQKEPRGIAESFIIGADFIGSSPVCLILGDNVFYGHGLRGLLERSVAVMKRKKGGIVFSYWVKDPQRYANIQFNKNKKVVKITEKPSKPKSNFAIVGLYFFDNSVAEIAKTLTPSKRGELEITDIMKDYLKKGRLAVEDLGRGSAWLDTGTHQSLLEASNFVATIEHRQGLKVACLEEIAYVKKFINKRQMLSLARSYSDNQYGRYLSEIIEREECLL